MDWALFQGEGMNFFFRWIHFIAGVTWIGVLYYFNFIQGEWFKEIKPEVKNTAVQSLVPRALWWFRWGAMFTWLSGMAMLMYKGHMAGMEIYSTSWGILILTGALMGTFMFLNVWLIIWPAQKVVIASTEAVAKGGQADPRAAQLAPKAALASRTNTLFSFPMLFFMGAASHLPLTVAYDFNCWTLCAVLGVIIIGIELNAVFGKMGPLASVKGVIHMGVVLTSVLTGSSRSLHSRQFAF